MRAALLGNVIFRSLGEQTLVPREEKLEGARQTLGRFLDPAVPIVFALLPLDLDPAQQMLAGVPLGVTVLWICEAAPVPVGGLIGVEAAVILGIAPAGDVLAPSGPHALASIGASDLAAAMLKHCSALCLSITVHSIPGVGRSTASKEEA